LTMLNEAVSERIGQRPSGAADGHAITLAARAIKQKALLSLASELSTPIKPERVVEALNRLLPERAVIVADPGTPCPYFSAYFNSNSPGRHFITNRAHGALGFSLSAGIGASFGRPDAMVVSVMGDGSFGFTCGEMETLVR